MKIIKINKKYNSGNIEHYMVLMDESYSNDDIDSIVDDWCETDINGMNYGYSYNWYIINNDITIKNIIKDKIKNYDEEINYINEKKKELEKFI